jgi:ketosteroid isomerase-like protein
MVREENIQTSLNLLRFLEKRKLKEFSELFSENGKWIHPYHSGLFPAETKGRKEIYKGIQTGASNFTEIKFPVEKVLPFLDPNKVAVKHTGRLVMKNGGIYENDYLAILSFDEQGKILEWAEYYNPIKAAKAFGLMDKIK